MAVNFEVFKTFEKINRVRFLKGKTQRGENLKNKVPTEKDFSLYLKQQERSKKIATMVTKYGCT